MGSGDQRVPAAARRKRLCRTVHPYANRAVAVGARASQCREAPLRAASIPCPLEPVLGRPVFGLSGAETSSIATPYSRCRCVNRLSSVSRTSRANHLGKRIPKYGDIGFRPLMQFLILNMADGAVVRFLRHPCSRATVPHSQPGNQEPAGHRNPSLKTQTPKLIFVNDFSK